MANVNTPSGLSPVQYRNGNAWNGMTRLYHIPSTDGNAYWIGDLVGSVATSDANGISDVVRGVAGSPIRGVIAAIGTTPRGGPYLDPSNLSLTSAPATKTQDYYVAVVDDPDVIFEIQELSTGTPGGSTSMSKNANFVFGLGTTPGVSGTTLDNATYATTSSLNLKVVGAVQRADNVPFTASQKLLVLINNHEFSAGIAGI